MSTNARQEEYDLLMTNLVSQVERFNKVYGDEITVHISPQETYVKNKDGDQVFTDEIPD